MLIGYARVSKADGSQSLDLQRDAPGTAGVTADAIYEDQASGERDDRPALVAYLKALRSGEVLVVWKLDRLGSDLRHLVDVVQNLIERGVGLRVLAGQGAQIDTTTPGGSAHLRYLRGTRRVRTRVDPGAHCLAAARARGRCKGGRGFALTKAQVRLAQAAIAHRDTSVAKLCAELVIRPVTLYRYVAPAGNYEITGNAASPLRVEFRPIPQTTPFLQTSGDKYRQSLRENYRYQRKSMCWVG